MPIRYSDFTTTYEKTADFVNRKQKPGLMKIGGLFFLALACLGVAVFFLPPFYAVALLLVIVSAMGAYAITEIQRIRDMVVAAEYQNAMFASALGQNSRFCMIVKREGTIVYMDSGLQKMFPELVKERQFLLINLLKTAKGAADDREKVLEAVQRNVIDKSVEKILLGMRAGDGLIYPVLLSVQQITRPSGYVLLRGWDYVEDRNGVANAKTQAPIANPLLSKSSIAMFAHIMDRMGMGLYMIDMSGNMLYANPVLEHWLSFNEGDITAGKFTMRDVVHGLQVEDTLNPGDFEGEHSLLKKEGGIIKAYINQKTIYGDNNKPLGCVALITNMVESDAELKKKLW